MSSTLYHDQWLISGHVNSTQRPNINYQLVRNSAKSTQHHEHVKTEFTKASTNKWIKTDPEPKLFTLYRKLLYDCFNSSMQHQTSKTSAELHVKQLKVQVKWNWWWNFTGVWSISLKFEILEFSLVPLENCFRCYFRQLFISSALRKCQKGCKIFNIILVTTKPEIAPFFIWFCLKTSWRTKWKIFKFCWRHKGKHGFCVSNVFQL